MSDFFFRKNYLNSGSLNLDPRMKVLIPLRYAESKASLGVSADSDLPKLEKKNIPQQTEKTLTYRYIHKKYLIS